MKMAASRMSRIAGRRLTLLSLLVMAAVLTPASSATAYAKHSTPAESVEDAEVIPGHVVLSAASADGDTAASATPFDLKKHNSNSKKFQKIHPKTESEWNFKGEGKKTDVYIKDAKDNRLLRLITEGLITPQDILPIVSNDAIISSQKSVSKGEISVTVQPEGMTGLVDDGLAADSDERIIMEKKKNATKEKAYHHKLEMDASRESDESVKINPDANVGVQSPVFAKQKDSITVPAQKQISLSKGKESHTRKRLNDANNFDVISLHKPTKDRQPSSSSAATTDDEGVFDFVDSPLSNKNLVPAGTAQTSRINVKKGPNGQDYEYEYVYYYYYDDDNNNNNNNNNNNEGTNRDGKKPAKSNEIPVSVSSSTPAARTTITPTSRHSSTPATRFTKTFDDNSNTGTRIKSADVLNEQSQLGRDKLNSRPDFRYTSAGNNGALLSPYPASPNKQIASNDLTWQYEQTNNRFPGRQIPPQPAPEQARVTLVEGTVPPTRQSSRGRVQYNTLPATTTDDSNYLITAQPVSTVAPPRETQTRGRTSGTIRQPGLELVDSNSFRTHSTRVPNDYEQYPTAIFEGPVVGKSIKQNSESTVSQNIPSVSLSSTKGDILRTKASTIEYISGTERLQPTPSPIGVSPSSTEDIVDNTAPQSTLQEGTLTTVYGAGLTDKAAHDLYAIYQQTQNEETVKNTIAQDDRTTVVDEPEGGQYIATNLPITTIFIPSTTTTTTTTTPAPTTTPSTTTTTTTPAPTFAASPGKRFRGSSPRSRHTTTTTEAAVADGTSEATERTRVRFQPQNRREPGQHRISAYGRKSTTVSSAVDGEVSSSTFAPSGAEAPTRQTYSSRNRYRGSTRDRSESATSADNAITSAPISQHSRPNYSERFNNRRRPGLRGSTTTAAPSSFSDEESATVKQEASSEGSSPADAQQSTTFRSTRQRQGQNSQVRPLRPGPKINFAGRGRFAGTTTTTTASVPLDTDTSGSADAPVEQRHEESADNGEASGDTLSSPAISSSAATTSQPDALHRLRNRPRIRLGDKGGTTKAQAQQSNSTGVSQNRKHLVNNLLARKKQPTTTTESQEVREEKAAAELLPRPVSEDFEETPSKVDPETQEAQQQVTEASSTTESKLSSLLASRRRNMSPRKPGTLSQQTIVRQTANEES